MKDGRRTKRIMNLIIFPTIIIGSVLLVVFNWDLLWNAVRDEARLEMMIESAGIFAPLAYIGVQVVQIVVFIIPGEATQIAGGYLFGVWFGTLYAMIGAAIGTVITFMIGRTSGKGFLEELFSEKQVDQFDPIINSKHSRLVFFLLFLIPAIPKDVLCYIGGITNLKLKDFLVLSLAGRFPALFLSMFFGTAVAEGNLTVMITVGVIAVVLFCVGVVFRQKIINFFSNYAEDDAK